jgi:hypothetical protein
VFTAVITSNIIYIEAGIAHSVQQLATGSMIESPGRIKNFLFTTQSRPALEFTETPIQWIFGAPSPGIKRPWHELDHPPPANAEIKKMFNYLSTGTTFPFLPLICCNNSKKCRMQIRMETIQVLNFCCNSPDDDLENVETCSIHFHIINKH